MSSFARIALLSAALLPALAQAQTYTIEPTHTFPTWSVTHMVSTFTGKFTKTTGTITLDHEAKTGAIHIEVDPKSVLSGVKKLDEHMQNHHFFNSDKFPKIVFDSTQVTFNGDVPVSAAGTLTMLGITKPVTLAVDNFKCMPHPFFGGTICGADIKTVIKRSEWGMTYGIPMVGDEVTLNIEIEAFKDKLGGPK